MQINILFNLHILVYKIMAIIPYMQDVALVKKKQTKKTII